jgi:hypothetical protein
VVRVEQLRCIRTRTEKSATIILTSHAMPSFHPAKILCQSAYRGRKTGLPSNVLVSEFEISGALPRVFVWQDQDVAIDPGD